MLCHRVCHLSREERLFAHARQQLDTDLDIVKFLKKIRRLERVQKKLSSKLDLKEDDSVDGIMTVDNIDSDCTEADESIQPKTFFVTSSNMAQFGQEFA